MKRKAEEDMQNNEALQEYKKKNIRDMEVVQGHIDEAHATNERLEKSRRKAQAEVCQMWGRVQSAGLIFRPVSPITVIILENAFKDDHFVN